MRRTNIPAFLTLFDFGDATTTSDGRSDSTVAPQSLYLMNSKFMSERADSIAKFLLRRETDDRSRLERLYWLALARPPAGRELDAALNYLDGFPGRGQQPAALESKWASLCRTILGSSEFLYVF
jgi:hypothetical protein